MLRRVLLAIAVTLGVVAVILAVSGGFRTTVGGFRISARSPLSASIAALVAGAAWFVLARRDRAIASDLEATWLTIERNASRLIGVIALIAAIVASTFATRSAAGADASGYLSEATMLASRAHFHFEPLATELADLDGWLTTPLGWRPSSVLALQAPTYPPGLPILMALPHAVAGLDGANTVVIASAAAAIWATGLIAGGIAGIVAAALLAFSPAFLYQSFQPMSDVPVTAAWTMCFLLVQRRSTWAGVACATAILIRPNLAPLAFLPLIVTKHKMTFAIPIAIAAVCLGFVQWLWYGSPLRSGYGTAEELFSIASILPNAGRYASWLVATSPVLFFATLGFARVRKEPRARALAVFALFVIASYLIYAVFDHWSYLRFLLPAMAVFAVFAAIELVVWIERWPLTVRFPIFLALTLGVIAYSLFVSRTLDTFKLAEQLQRVEQAAEFINRSAPPDAVLIAGEQSGSMRYYTARSILRWEAATPEQLSKAIAALAERPIFVVLDAWENEPFVAKFKDLPAVSLDWPAMVDAGTSHRTRVWQLSDRARFLSGEKLDTVRLP